jgi:hypothetical protein
LGNASTSLTLSGQSCEELEGKDTSINQSTKSVVNAAFDFNLVKTLRILCPKDGKGNLWETYCQFLLKTHNVPFEGNPLDPSEWKKTVGKGADIRMPQLDAELECKFNLTRVYPSFINRDFIPRFSGKAKYKLVETNDLKVYSASVREVLRKAGIRLVNPEYLLQFLTTLIFRLHKGANKYIVTLIEASSRRGQPLEVSAVLGWFRRLLPAIFKSPGLIPVWTVE